jgi:hypothetical protein
MREALAFVGCVATILGASISYVLHTHDISTVGAWILCAAGLGAIGAAAWPPSNGIVIRRSR